MSCGLTLQICLIIALSFRCRRWRQGFVTGQVSLAWSIALRTHVLYTRPRVLKERWREERTGFSSLNFFQYVHKIPPVLRGSFSQSWLYEFHRIPREMQGISRVVGGNFQTREKVWWVLQENLDDFNPFHGILCITRKRDRSNFPAECTVP